MNELSLKIGLIAEEVWQYLLENGKEASTIKIKTNLEMSNTTLYLALGWLLREDKVNIIQDEYSYLISLK
ncbi:MAG: winged helix-turn-helix domain-containing protein [Endomicrobium sp.]|jgi:hypothetical protein|nr:winged helix-turn-helix domain-containing protein [Endomicrobium sp.]